MNLYLVNLLPYEAAKRLYRFRKAIQFTGICFLLFGACLMVTGCSGLPGWLSAIENTIPLVAETIGAVLMAISAALGGDPALAAAAQLINDIASKGEAAIRDIQAMVQEYQANPSPTLLGKIKEGIQAAVDNIKQLLGDLGVPAPLSATIQALAQVVLTQLEAWMNVLPAIQALEEQGAAAARSVMNAIPADQHPLDAKQFAAKINDILGTPTGDEKADAILAGVPRLQAA